MSTLSDKITRFETDADLAHKVVHGGPTETVETEGGPVRSLAKLVADCQAAFDAAGSGVVGEAKAAALLAGEKAQLAIENAAAAALSAQGAASTFAGSAKKTDFISFAYALTPAELADASLALPVIDLSVKVQAFIDANKGKRLLFPAPYRYLFAGVTCIGASYSGTEFVFQGQHVLRARASTSENTSPIPAYAGLLLKDCDITLSYFGHGNRANQPDEEHCYNVAVAGANVICPVFKVEEIKGDGCYVSQSLFSFPSALPTFHCGIYDAKNSADDGRNAITIISAKSWSIGSLRSVKIGAVVTGVRQPGGFCLEPNSDFHTIDNGVIGSAYIESSGGTCFQIAGAANTKNCRNIAVGPVVSINTSAPNTAAPVSGENIANQYRFLNVVNADGVTIPSFRGEFSNAYGDGAIFASCSNIKASGSSKHCRISLTVGGSTSATGANESEIDWKSIDMIQAGVRTGELNGVKLRGKVSNPVGGHYSTVCAVWSLGSDCTQKDATYSIDVAFSSVWTRSYRNDASFPVTYVNCFQRDCDRSGAWIDQLVQVGDMKMPMVNVIGVTVRSAIPPALASIFVDGQTFQNIGSGAAGEPSGWRFDLASLVMRPIPSSIHARRVSRNYQVTENFDASLYDSFSINIQSSPALTYNAPTGGAPGQRIAIRIRNVSGGVMGAITWNAAFKMSGWTNPANQKNRVILFEFDGTNWNEVSQSPADIPN